MSSEITISQLQPSTSLTHEQLLSLIHTELIGNPRGETIEILDVGCGGGIMLLYLLRNLKILWPSKTIKVFGFDVSDHSTQAQGFFEQATLYLKDQQPDYPWSESIHLIKQGEDWPFSDKKFDFIVSNQVLEHVFTRDHFFSQLKRCLKQDGYSCHLFPLREVIYDGHVFMPWVHRFKNQKTLERYMLFCGLLGFGSYWHFKKQRGESFSLTKLKDWCVRNSQYVIDSCHYISQDDLVEQVRDQGFDINFDFSLQYYKRKFCQMLGRQKTFDYSRHSVFLDRWCFKGLKKISSITVNLRLR